MSSTWVVRCAWGSMQLKPHLPTPLSSSRTLRAFRMYRIWVLSVPFSLGHAHSVSHTGSPYLSATASITPCCTSSRVKGHSDGLEMQL